MAQSTALEIIEELRRLTERVTDDQFRERVAIEVEHLPDAEAQAEYDRRTR